MRYLCAFVWWVRVLKVQRFTYSCTIPRITADGKRENNNKLINVFGTVKLFPSLLQCSTAVRGTISPPPSVPPLPLAVGLSTGASADALFPELGSKKITRNSVT